jgi:hypothetical protein
VSGPNQKLLQYAPRPKQNPAKQLKLATTRAFSIEEINMRIKFLLLAITLGMFSQSVLAQLEPFEDYDVSDSLWNITMVKVDSNMGDYYLEGLRDTWVASNKLAVELGQMESFSIFRSQLPASGSANLFLVVKFANNDQLEPNKAEYDKFMAAWGEANQEKSRKIVADYPSMREITDEYLVREITIK